MLADRIRRPVGDPAYLVIELDFDTEDRAEAFRDFLASVVWSNPEASPALAGTPTTRVLEQAAS